MPPSFDHTTMTVPDILPAEPTVDADAERGYLLRATLSGATLLMVGLSWPLWIDLADFPAIPFVRWFPDYPRIWSWLGLGLIVAGLGLGITRRRGRIGLGLTIATMAWLILGDQLRFQPWVYQFLVMGFLLLALPPRRALAFSRAYLISLYFYSGLSKFDVAFATGMGPEFLRTLDRVLRLKSMLSASHMIELVYVMPLAEMAIAFLLISRRTRLLGYLGLLAIHGTLLLILGPWGLGHSTIVLVWNVALVVEEALLFWPVRQPARGPDPWSRREWLVAVPLGMVLALPLGESSGRFDSWPSHALYASHCERSRLSVRGPAYDALPAPLRRFTLLKGGRPPTSTEFTPNDWTLLVRGVPAYPQIRYANGLAEWLASRGAGPGRWPIVSVVHSKRADRYTNRRERVTYDGPKEIRDAGDRFWFNAHPRDRSME